MNWLAVYAVFAVCALLFAAEEFGVFERFGERLRWRRQQRELREAMRRSEEK